MADYTDLTGLTNSERNALQANGGVGNYVFGALGGATPMGAMPFALAGNVPTASWSNSVADTLGAPFDAAAWALRQAGVSVPQHAGLTSDAWRGAFSGSIPWSQPEGAQSFWGTPAGFLGAPVDFAGAALRHAGLPVPRDAPFSTPSWQAMIDTYSNAARRPAPPLTLDDIWQIARRAHPF